MGMVCSQDQGRLMDRKAMEKAQLDIKLQTDVIKMVRTQELDSYFNLDVGSTESQKAERMFDKFADDCE